MATDEEIAPEAAMTVANAISHLEDIMNAHDVTAIQSTTLEDLQAAAREIERNQNEVCNLRRLGGFFASLGKFSAAARPLCDAKAMAWTWISADQPHVLKELISAYKRIGQALPALDSIESAKSANSEVQQLLASCFADLLEFHGRCYKVFRRYSWSMFFKTSWARLEPWLRTLLDDLMRYHRQLRAGPSAQDLNEAREARAIRDKSLATEEEDRALRELKNAEFWLEGSKFDQEDELDELRKRCHGNSCDWIYENEKVKSWLRNGHSHSILWLKGKPGSGKSVLCSKLIERIQSSRSPKTVYLMCNDSQSESRQCRSLLQALAWQLVRDQPHLCAAVQIDFINQASQRFSKPQIRRLLQLALSSYPSVRIIIDGLDECDDKQQEEILEEMNGLARPTSSSSICKILISSQDIRTIFRKLHTRTNIDLSKERIAIQTAISSFVRAQVAQSPLFRGTDGLNKKEIENVEQTLIDKADGMFLWVRLVISMLEHSYTPGDMKKALQDLPKGLDEVYDKIFARFRLQLEPPNRDRASRIFQWLICSPRHLKRYEIQDVIALSFDQHRIDRDTRGFEHVIELCKPLIESGTGDTIRFVHISVQKYLLEYQPLFKLEEARCTVTFSCLAYLLNHGVNLIAPDFDAESRCIEVGQGIHGLCRYAVDNWVEHLLSYISEPEPTDPGRKEKVLQVLENLAATLSRISPQPRPDFSQTKLDSRCDMLKERKLAQTFVISALVERLERRIGPAKEKAASTIEHPLRSMRRKYDEIARQLLQAHSVPGLDEGALESFKRTYGSSVLICRSSNCPRGLQGFDTVQERDAHEATHQLRCPYAGCLYHRTGIGSEKKLKEHIAKSHPEEIDATTQPSIKPFGQLRTDTDATLIGSPEPGPKDGPIRPPSDVDGEDNEDEDNADTNSFFLSKLDNIFSADKFALGSTRWT